MRDIFTAEDTSLITSIHLSKQSIPDKLIWRETDSGTYTVKSRYYMARQILGKEMQQGHQRQKIWSIIWRARVLPKIKYFAWRMVQGLFPTCTQLLRRGLQVNNVCYVCGSHGETLSHTFYYCRFSIEAWRLYYPEILQILDDFWEDRDKWNHFFMWL